MLRRKTEGAKPFGPHRMMFFLDLDNLRTNTAFLEARQISLIAGLDRLQRQIIQDIDGEIVRVYVFASSPHLTYTEAEAFYKQGFYVLVCPRIKTKAGEDEDTVDEQLMEFLKEEIDLVPDLTHICLGSGDKHFCRALRKALRKGIKLIIVAGDLSSLSQDLIDVADVNPRTGKKMTYVFSPTAD